MKAFFTGSRWNWRRSFGVVALFWTTILAAATTPVVTGFSPTNGTVNTSVAIFGTNLLTATNVQFNGTSASFQVFGNQLIASVPTNATTGPIAVSTPGGRAVSTNFFEVTSPLPPQVDGFTPTSGAAGTSVTVSGANFAGATSVWFGGKPALFNVSFNGTNLTATVPANATTGFITVATPAGTNSSLGLFTVTATPAPSIASFSPGSGAAGTRVTITGTNFSGATAVRFNGVNAQFSPGFFGASLTAIVPIGATTGPISVATPGGTNTSAAVFTIAAIAPPQIGGFDPIAGLPGAKITIVGTDLALATQVKFNGASAVFSTFAGSLIATVPTNATPGLISVTTPGGTATTTNSFFAGAFHDLVLDVNGPTNTLQVGDAVTYLVSVTNLGPSVATNVVVANQLPAGMSTQFIFSKGGDCVNSNGVVTCNFAKVASGDSAWVKIFLAVNAGSSFTNLATALADGFDPDLSNNSFVHLNPPPVVLPPPPPPSPPTLAIQAFANASIELAWPTNSATFILESTASLLPPVAWFTISTPPVVAGGQNHVTVSGTSGVKFFRLRTP